MSIRYFLWSQFRWTFFRLHKCSILEKKHQLRIEIYNIFSATYTWNGLGAWPWTTGYWCIASWRLWRRNGQWTRSSQQCRRRRRCLSIRSRWYLLKRSLWWYQNFSDQISRRLNGQQRRAWRLCGERACSVDSFRRKMIHFVHSSLELFVTHLFSHHLCFESFCFNLSSTQQQFHFFVLFQNANLQIANAILEFFSFLKVTGKN